MMIRQVRLLPRLFLFILIIIVISVTITTVTATIPSSSTITTITTITTTTITRIPILLATCQLLLWTESHFHGRLLTDAFSVVSTPTPTISALSPPFHKSFNHKRFSHHHHNHNHNNHLYHGGGQRQITSLPPLYATPSNTNTHDENDGLMERLKLTTQFERWKFLQSILEGEANPHHVNQVLYRVLYSFYVHPRPLVLDGGDTNPSPRLNRAQREVVRELLVSGGGDDNEDGGDGEEERRQGEWQAKEKGSIAAFVEFDKNTNENNTILNHNNNKNDDDIDIDIDMDNLYIQLSKLLPDPNEDEDAYKSGWDMVTEMYGREATKLAERGSFNVDSGDDDDDEVIVMHPWKHRSVVARLLLHYDFLSYGLEQEKEEDGDV